MDISHLISRCTAIAANERRTRTIGIAVIVTPNSAELWETTRIKSYRSDNTSGRDGRQGTNLNHLHGDTNEEKEIKLEQTDDNLVPSVHCYSRVGSDPIEV